LLQQGHDMLSASFSPGEAGRPPRWIAYSSNETGRFEVYVRDLPAGDRKWQGSICGGWLPPLPADCGAVVFLHPGGTLMAANIHPGSTFQPDTPQALFETKLRITSTQLLMSQYAISRDGQRFLFNRRLPEPDAGAITAVVPW